jgi:hypothetical protein
MKIFMGLIPFKCSSSYAYDRKGNKENQKKKKSHGNPSKMNNFDARVDK